MTTMQIRTEYAVDYKEDRFRFSLSDTEKERIRANSKVELILLRIPSTYIFPPHEPAFGLSVLTYNELLCNNNNNISPTLVGQEVEHLAIFSVKYDTKIKSKMVDDVLRASTECVPSPDGEHTFGYIFDKRNAFINVSHLAAKYDLDFNRWRRNNVLLIQEYYQTTGMKDTELILEGPNTYVLPGLCTNFMLEVVPSFGNLMKIMSNVFMGISFKR
jgi:hypothetical protein